MNLSPLESENGQISPAAEKAITDSLGLISELSKQLRTMSHLLHPPLLTAQTGPKVTVQSSGARDSTGRIVLVADLDRYELGGAP